MANGLNLKERTPGRDIPENDPLMELSRIMGFGPSEPVETRVDPQIAAEDSFSMDLERELAFEEVPAESGSFDTDFAEAFEADLSETLRFEPDAPSVVPSLEDELSALLTDTAPGDLDESAMPSILADAPASEAELGQDSRFEPPMDGDLATLEMSDDFTDDLQPETVDEGSAAAFAWPELAKDDALEAELESGPVEVNQPLPTPVFNFDAGEDQEFDRQNAEPVVDDFAIEASEYKPQIELSDDIIAPDQFEYSNYQAVESSDLALETSATPVVGDSEYNPEDGFDAFRELAALVVPPAPEFGEWPAESAPVHHELEAAEIEEGHEFFNDDEPAPLVEASEVRQDEVVQTDDFEIPDFEFQSLSDASQQSDSYDEFADEIELAQPVHLAKAETGKPAFDDADFDFDSLISEELAAGAGAVAIGAAAMPARSKPAMHVDADLDADPFQRTAIADDVFAPVAADPVRRKPWLMPVAFAGVLALLGGGLYYSFSGDGASVNAEGPALVKADPEPVKIAPENPGGATVANQDKAVYDKVEGDQASLPAQGALVSESEEPVDIAAVTPPAEPATPVEAASPAETPVPSEDTTVKAEDRVETPAAEATQAPAAETAAVTPKKVRTVIVKPDGTLVERPVEAAAAPVPESAAAAPAPESSAVASIASAEPPAAEAVPVASAEPVPAAEDPIAQIAAVEPEAPKAPEAAPAKPVAVEAQPEPAAPEPAIKVVKSKKNKAPAVEEAAAPAAPVDAAPFGERPADQPVNIVGKTGGQRATAETQVAAADPAPAPAAGAYSIQIASTPSPEAAKSTYAALSRKFGGVIGGKGVNIQKANVEGKGTVYRIRIPAGSKQNAAALCSDYKAAGGSCFVTK
jgi:hypothetical protein